MPPSVSWLALQEGSSDVHTSTVHNTLTHAKCAPLPQHLHIDWGLDFVQIQHLYFRGLVFHALSSDADSMLMWWAEYVSWLAALHEIERTGSPPAGYRSWMRASHHRMHERHVDPHSLPSTITIHEDTLAGTATARLPARTPPSIPAPSPILILSHPHGERCVCLACCSRRRVRPSTGRESHRS